MCWFHKISPEKVVWSNDVCQEFEESPCYYCPCVCVCMLSCILFATLWTDDHKAPLSMRFFRQEYMEWSGLPCPPPGNLPDPEIKSASLDSLISLALADGSLSLASPGNPIMDPTKSQLLWSSGLWHAWALGSPVVFPTQEQWRSCRVQGKNCEITSLSHLKKAPRRCTLGWRWQERPSSMIFQIMLALAEAASVREPAVQWCQSGDI